MLLINYPWRILNLGFFLQITYRRPLRLTILQSSLRFLMDVLTFISVCFYLYADVFYDADPDMWKSWASLGVLGVEMESYALYCNAAKLGKKALCLLTVTDSFINKTRKATPEERVVGLTKMIELAIEVAEKFA